MSDTKIESQKKHISQLTKISETARQEKLDLIAEEQAELARLNTQVTVGKILFYLTFKPVSLIRH